MFLVVGKMLMPDVEVVMLVGDRMLLVAVKLLPVDALWMSVDKKLLPVTVKLDTGC